MDKYSRGKIYLIRNRNNESLIYVGSTIEIYLSKRFQKHKSHKGCSLYKYINNPDNNTNWDEWYIELYEEFSCENKLQLCKRENEIIREKATINKIGYRTEEIKKQKEKEWRENNIEKLNKYSLEYYESNREKVLAKKVEYNKNHKEEIKQYMNERYKKKKDELIEKSKQYREKNNEKMNCDCGSCIFKYKLNDHLKTKKHIKFLNNIPS